jgi:branched-chain amino acid aminotransferase
MVQKTETIWMDGELVPWDQAQVHVLTHTLHYGLGVFEGIRAYLREDGRSAIFRMREHIERLVVGARMMTIPLDYSVEELMAACVKVCRSNRLDSCYLRPIVFVGAGEMGVAAMSNKTQVSIAAWPWGAYLGDEGLARGVRIRTSSFSRPHVNSQLHKGKVCGHYVNSILAKREALLEGYDEAMLLDTQGYVAEASGENIFMVRNGEIFTPPYGAPILGGITRNTLITIARDMGYVVNEQPMTRDMLYFADEVFMCGTAAEVTPVREIDRRTIGSGVAGSTTLAIQQRYFDVVKGSDISHPEWYTFYQIGDL